MEIGEIKARLELDTNQFQVSIGQVRSDLQQMSGSLQQAAGSIKSLQFGDLGDRIGTLAGSVKNLFGNLASGSLDAARSFEQLQAKLVSVTGSVSEANQVFTFAKNFAAQTPFDVKGIVDAATVLGGFKQDIQGLLPVAANLAAAMGKDISEATLVLAKAASGSAEGFEQLRNSYAITTKELVKFGAASGKMAGSLSHAESDIERNRNALVKLIQTRYGDAIARQSATLSGAISNAGDAAVNLAASFGQTLIPAATAAARGIAGILEAMQAIPGPVKAAVAAGTVLVAGVAAIATAAAGAVTGLVLLQGTMAALAPQSAAAAAGAGALSTALTAVGTAAVSATRAMVALATSPLGVALGAIGITAGLAGLKIAEMDAKARAAGVAIADSSRKIVQGNQAFREMVSVLNVAGKSLGQTVSIVGDSREQIQQLQAALKSLTPQQIATALTDAGESVDSLNGKISELTKTKDVALQKFHLLTEAAQLLQDGMQEDRFREVQKALADLGVVVEYDTRTLGDITNAAKGALAEFNRFAQTKGVLEQFVGILNTWSGPIVDATEASKELGKYLNLAESVGTANALAAALARVDAQIAANAQTAKIGTQDLAQLLEKLQDPKTDSVTKGLIEQQIALIQERGTIIQAQAKLTQDAADKEAKAAELSFRRRQALQGESLAEELNYLNTRLQAVEANSEAEVTILERIAAIKKQQMEDQKKQLEEFNAFAASLGEGALSLGEQFGAGVSKANLDEITGKLATIFGETEAASGRVQAINKAILDIKRQIAAQQIEESAGQDQINQLTQQKATLEQQITQQKQTQTQTLAALEIQLLEQQNALLKQKKQNGENVDAAIGENEVLIFKAKMDAIEAERQATIKATGDRVFAQEQASKKTQILYNQETLRKGQELKKQEVQLDSSLKTQEKIIQKHFDRIGGKNSPLQSFEEAFAGPNSFSLGDFSFGNFALGASRSRANPKIKRAAPAGGGGFSGGSTSVINYNTSINGQTLQDPQFNQVLIDGINRQNVAFRHAVGGA